MFMVNLYGAALNADDRDFLARYQPGGVVLMDGNASTPDAVTRLTNSYQQTITDAGGLPLLIAVDQEGGPIAGLEQGFTPFPTPALLTAASDPDLAAQAGAAIAEELRAVGVNMNLAPVADLENPDNIVLARRSFGSDPAMTGPVIAGFVHGSQAAGVLATAKHFPGHGGTSGDSHTLLPVINFSRERLEMVEIVPFRAAIEASVEAVMAAHIIYPAYDETLPASLSPVILTDVLREQLGFDGLILTDALDMDAIDTNFSYPEAAVRAIQAGADLLLSAHIGWKDHVAAIEAIADAVKVGTISEARINESVHRILDVKQRYGLLDWQPLEPATATDRVNLAAHEALLNELFLAGVTVALDRHNLIPIPLERPTALIYPATRVQVANECKPYHPDLKLVGVSDAPSAEEIGWAQDAARRSDMVIVFTQNAITTTEQQTLVNALPPDKTAVVALWSPYDFTTFPGVAAYLVTYSPARPAVPAACRILFGDAPATGRLSLTLADALPAGSRG
ncbi:MAG: beta-N-acetylhexosaminidase [Chloroflexi bacterium]|nr:beta-N-acetylhexosaminidase [Chloroflexota bacterium]